MHTPSGVEITTTPPIARAGSWRTTRFVLAIVALVLLVFVGYWPSLKGGFVWDDLVLVKKNPLITGELNLRTVWFATDFSLTTVVTWIEWLAFGEHPLGYRLTNLLLHCFNALLLHCSNISGSFKGNLQCIPSFFGGNEICNHSELDVLYFVEYGI